jgi:class 3 adenylate cyclase/tetratricopeptide (TPR) repeat protein
MTEPSALVPYVPRLTLEWARADEQVDGAAAASQVVDGTMVFADISGFTKMSERLARHGKVGAEEVTDAINTCFEQLLAIAYALGGSLLKFGGDALLLLFAGDDHATRAAHAAVGMRHRLRTVGRLQTSSGLVVLRISIGVHSGAFHFFALGGSHRELIVVGPAATATVAAEGSATAGEIVMSAATAALLPSRSRGPARGEGFLLRAPAGQTPIGPIVTGGVDRVDAARYVPVAIRLHLLDGGEDSEHRSATVAFLHFDGTDEILEREGPEVLGEQLDSVVRTVQRAADEHEVTLLGSDIDLDGGKLILVSGVPRRVGDDEQRMLTALRQIADANPPIPLRIGAHTGSVFAGAVGPPYRRTFTVMGDTVNLAARVMSKALPRQVLVTPDVLDRSQLTFETEALEPFTVKGKRRPVTAFALGAPNRAERSHSKMLPLVGRTNELAALEIGLRRAAEGVAIFVEIVGDAGMGKSRLVEELRVRAGDARCMTIRCEAYESGVPYAPFWVLLRYLLGVELNEHRDEVARRLREVVTSVAPELLASLPLLGTSLDLDIPDTPETASLEPEFRRQRVDEVTAAFLLKILPAPAVLVFEDAHHMDELSVGLLHRVISLAPPLLLGVTRRPAETGFVADEDETPTLLELLPLTEDEAVEAVIAATDDAPLLPSDVRVLAERAAGSPLFLDEMLRALSADGNVDALPASIDAAVTAQIDRLPARHRQILRRAAVLGLSFSKNDLAGVLAPDLPAPEDATLRGLGEFLLPDGAVGLRFRHAIMRDAVYEALPFRQRRELHGRAGRALELALGDDAEVEAAVLSMHFLEAQRHAEAWRYAGIAGERARAVYANTEAAALFERALAAARRLPHLPTVDIAAVWEKLGEVRERGGVYDGALRAYRSARRLLRGDAPGEAKLLLKEAWIPERVGRHSEAVRALRKGMTVLESATGAEADQQRAEIYAAYAAMRQTQGRYREAIEWCERAIELARASGSRKGEAHALYILDWAWASIGRFDLATHSDRALEIYAELGDITGEACALQNLGGFAYYQGRWDEAVDLYERARDARLRTGNEVDAAMGTDNIAEVLADQGHYAAAEQHLHETLRVWRAAGDRGGIAFARGLLGRVAARTGRFDEAHAHFDAARLEYSESGLEADCREVDGRIAECLVLEDRSEEALALADVTLGVSVQEDQNPPDAPLLQRVRGYALLQAGATKAAREAFEASLESARARDADYEVALTMVALAQLSSVEGDALRAEQLESEGSQLLERLGVLSLPQVPLPPAR